MRARSILVAFAAFVLPLALSAPETRAGAAGLQMPPYETLTLDNGLTLLLMKLDTVPLVTFEMWIDAGAALDAPGKEGLAALTADALRKGAGDYDAAELAEALDFLGARYQSSVDEDRTRLRLNLLAKDFDAGLGLLADMVLRPRFDETEVRKLADQMADAVTQSKENPRFVLSAYHRAHVFGKHPYGNPINGTETSLAALTRDDVAAFYRDRYGADRTILAVTGDLGPDVATQVRRAFAAMPAAGKPPVVIEPPPRPQGRNVLLVNKNDTPQTWFMIGSLGPKWGDPDYPAVELVRTVFGGRFTSWLNTKLRIESGLTYGARYSIDRGRVAGLASISSYTATETTRQALDLALEQLARLHEEGIGEKDLASAKAYLKGQLPYDYETAEDLATVICELTYYGLDRSFVDEMFDRIDAVTVEDCRRVIEKDFGQDDLVFTTIGVESEVGELLAEYGELTVRQNDAAGFGVEPMSSLNR